MSDGTATLPEREVRERRPMREERRPEEERRTEEVIAGGTAIGGTVAAGAGALAIIGLAGVYPTWMLTVATIALGLSFLFEGGSIVARMSDLLSEVTEGRIQMAELGAGTTGETLAGLVGIALGILGLVGVVPGVLIPSAAIVFGGALVIGAGTNVRINEMVMTHRQEHPLARRIARQAVFAATGLQVLVGFSAITLGILALVGVAPLTLSLAAMLGIGAMFLLSDATITGRMLSVLQR